MKILNKHYYDDNGNTVSEEEFQILYQEFENKYKKKYEDIVNQIISQINQRCTGNKQKLKMLFDYLTSDDMKYDLRQTTADGRRAIVFTYRFPPYITWGIESGSKYAVILNHSGVCRSYSEAFEDICSRMNIPCELVLGDTGMDHAWNVVMENGILKHIDIAYAIMNRTRHNKYDYFMKTFDELQQVAGHRTMNNSIDELKEHLTPKIKVTKRTDNQTPKIKVIDRSDKNIIGIRIIKRNDTRNKLNGVEK